MRDLRRFLALFLCALLLVSLCGIAENAGEGEAHMHPSPSLSDEVFPTDVEIALQMAAGELSADPRANGDCEHPEDALREYSGEETLYDGGNNAIVSYDETTHTRRYQQIEWTQCTLCGALVSASTKYENRAEPHTFKEGECTVCKYAEGMHELHIWPIAGDAEHWYVEEECSSLDAQTHQITETNTLFCAVCGDYLSETTRVTGEEPHTFTDGVCVCGYREDGGFGEPSETCQHLNVFASPSPRSNGEAVCIDENYHSMEVERVAYEIECLDCGAIIGSSVDYTPGRTFAGVR